MRTDSWAEFVGILINRVSTTWDCEKLFNTGFVGVILGIISTNINHLLQKQFQFEKKSENEKNS